MAVASLKSIRPMNYFSRRLKSSPVLGLSLVMQILAYKAKQIVLLYQGEILCQSFLAAPRETIMPILPCCTARHLYMPSSLA
jgi:hypothetical protein